MADRRHGGARFPSDRAFVVQMTRKDGDAAEFRGRVEHLTSGEFAYFDSLGALGAFVTRTLDQDRGGPSPNAETQ